MISIQILEPSDILKPDDWVRYLDIELVGQSDTVMTRSTYGGTPINFFRWLPVSQYLGPCWMNRPLGDFLKGYYGLEKQHQPVAHLEFARGPVPRDHRYIPQVD